MLICAQAGWEEGVEDQSKIFPPPAEDQGMGITAAMCLQYPLSRGTVHIKSSDPKEHPRIDPAFMVHPADAAVLAAGVKMLDKVAQSKHMEGKLAKRVKPDPKKDLSDTEQAKAHVYDWHLSEYHPCGSVALGDALDSRLRVNGVRNLRVADVSAERHNS